ncbi:MAG: glycoside hydrolase family 99-like domain-containing protein [Mucilaginibacter polytrichastri]|nr:glycoside hydrolase family 99-like domain-containing protein [Mucilaginibacter polytrichastri]
MKRNLRLLLASAALILVCYNLTPAQARKPVAGRKYDVAAFLYPAYASGDPRLRPFWPDGNGEWETVTSMQTRFPGHYWNRKPLWGTVNEADPAVMDMEIGQATRHGVNVFIFDWYWYDGRPFMETTLDSGFLRAPNHGKMKFYLMWANHDVTNTWDTRLNRYNDDNVIWTGKVDRQEFEKICRRNIDKYFKLPGYYRIDGKPVFMIYDLPNLINGLGGMAETIDALSWFRRETKKAGFPGLDLQFTMWSANFNYSGFDAGKSQNPQNDVLKQLGFSSSTHYQFAHFVNVNDDYLNILQTVKNEWAKIDSTFELPYYPHISIGWDNSPRLGKSAVVRNNTSANFEQGLRMAKAYLDAHPQQTPLITINSWNEWTETSYLQPDNVNGYGYLEAVRKVFSP